MRIEETGCRERARGLLPRGARIQGTYAFVSLNSRRESHKEEKKVDAIRRRGLGVGGYRGTSLIKNTHPHRITLGP